MRLELDRAGLWYQPGTAFAVRAVADVSLAIEAGERVGLAGAVGSGKSTLLELLSGITLPGEGRALHDGRELSRRSAAEPGSIGLAFQSPERCLFEKTVREDVGFGPRSLGLPRDEVGARVEEALLAVGLDPSRYGSRSPFSLSAGEQRRVALAGVMALKPRAMLLDEPTAHLDPATRREIVSRLVAISEETGATLVVAGHDMDELSELAGRVVLMAGGRVAADGPARQVLSDAEMLERLGLEPPATVRLGAMMTAAAGRAIGPFLTEGEAVDGLFAAFGGGA